MKDVLGIGTVILAGWTLIGSTAPLVQPTSPQTPAASPTGGSAWRIDPAHSAASFAVRHMLVSTVRGRLGAVTGSVTYDGRQVSSIGADVAIDVKAVDTANPTRDNDLRGEEFFFVSRYPTITFKSKRAEAASPGKFKLIGDLTIRDVTKEVTLDVEGPADIVRTSAREQRTAATATVTLNRFDYGLRWNAMIETGGAVVGPNVVVTIDLEVSRPAGGV